MRLRVLCAGNDLNGIMQLQRRLGGLQRDLGAIGLKVDSLVNGGHQLEGANPEEQKAIEERLKQLTDSWNKLNEMLRERDARLQESKELQEFLQKLDHFQVWLTRTQTTIASTELPNGSPLDHSDSGHCIRFCRASQLACVYASRRERGREDALGARDAARRDRELRARI